VFSSKKILVLNLMSSPGAGKTTLLEKTIDLLKDRVRIGVIEGDIQTSADAERIAGHNVQVVQINTDGACHLDGNMIREALPQLDLDTLDLLVVENVGNLVCPAEFDVGENHKVMILSTTEGDDKPKKYPLMFQESSVLLVNKIDLLPYINCQIEVIRRAATEINPNLKVLEISATSGEGLSLWTNWLEEQIRQIRGTD